ncbi:MAG TPA: hypothetical protein VLB83_03160, partial [Candidatus Paceibacterota bacterium]|nr:hypothetical protein [Candidatus Paceibacterota bacterium]
MTKDVLDPTLDEFEQREQANIVQALGRLAVGFGAIIATGLSGPLAKAFSFETVFWIGMIVPFCSVLGAILVKPQAPERAAPDWVIIGGGFAFGLLSLLYKVLGMPFAAEASFLTGCAIIVPLVLRLFRDLPKEEITVLIATGVMVFVFRATPLAGPGATAWQMEVLGFDKAFIGLLAFIAEMIGFVGIWFAVGWLRRATIARVYTVITIVGFVLALPTIAMFYGLHLWTEEHLGFGARSIALVDIALASPFGHLSLIPILALIARYAASACAATWFALAASFVNLALAAKQIGTVYLNKIWVVVPGTFDPTGALTRAGDYRELGELMIVANAIGLILPLLAIWLLRKKLI